MPYTHKYMFVCVWCVCDVDVCDVCVCVCMVCVCVHGTKFENFPGLMCISAEDVSSIDWWSSKA